MAPSSPQGSDKTSPRSETVCTNGHEFDHERHLPGEALCTVKHSASEKERILLAGAHTCHNQARVPKARISTSYVVQRQSFYLVKFADAGSKARYYLKHYNDFVALRKALQEFIDKQPWSESPISILPQLPETGRFGLRHKLSTIGMGSFAKKVQEELDGWLQMILAQISTLSALPALESFFGVDPMPASMPEQRAMLEDLHARLIRGTGAIEVATATLAATQDEEDDERKAVSEESDGESVTLCFDGAWASESAGLEKEDWKCEGEEVSVSNQPRQQLRPQKTAGAFAFESAGLEKVYEKSEEDELPMVPRQRRRQLRIQQTAEVLAFESAGLEDVDDEREAEGGVFAESLIGKSTEKTAEDAGDGQRIGF